MVCQVYQALDDETPDCRFMNIYSIETAGGEETWGKGKVCSVFFFRYV